MIQIFEGVIGAGKSYNAVLQMLDQWARGGTVYSNMVINWENVKAYVLKTRKLTLKDSQYVYVSSEERVTIKIRLPKSIWTGRFIGPAGQITDSLPLGINPDLLELDDSSEWKKEYKQEVKPVITSKLQNFQRFIKKGTRELPVLVVVDEAHLFWGARDWAASAEIAREMLAFLTQSRKAHTDIIFITQAIRNLDAQMARLIQFRWSFRDLAKIRIGPFGWPFQTTLACKYDYDGVTLVARQFQARKKEIFTLYDSHAFLSDVASSETAEAVDVGGKPEGRFTWERLKLPVFAALFIGMLVGVWLFFRRGIVLPGSSASQGQAQVAGAAGTAVPAASPPVEPAPVRISSSPGIIYDGAEIAELQSTPDVGIKTILLPVYGYQCQGGEWTLFAEHPQYGRYRLSVGDIFPPYEIRTIEPSGGKLPTVGAIDLERNQWVTLRPFKVGIQQDKQQIENNKNELANIVRRAGSGGNGLSRGYDPANGLGLSEVSDNRPVPGKGIDVDMSGALPPINVPPASQ